MLGRRPVMTLRSELIAVQEIKPNESVGGDILDEVRAAKARGMVCLWQAVAEQIADPEAMRAHVTMARTLLGRGRTSTRLLK
jgi:hypothetical protein